MNNHDCTIFREGTARVWSSHVHSWTPTVTPQHVATGDMSGNCSAAA